MMPWISSQLSFNSLATAFWLAAFNDSIASASPAGDHKACKPLRILGRPVDHRVVPRASWGVRA